MVFHPSKIAICIFGCASIEPYKTEIIQIQNTWGKRAKQKECRVFFFLGEKENIHPTEIYGDEYIFLKGVGSDYESASHKQNLGLKYIYENHPEIEYTFVCGTDTYVNIDKLIDFLKKTIQPLTIENTLLICGHNDYRIIQNEKVCFPYGGAGFILNKNALNQLYPILETMFENWKQLCGNPDYIAACDLCIGYYATKLHFSFLKFWHLFLDCNYLGHKHSKQTPNLYYVCCENKIILSNVITCHNMSHCNFIDYTAILEINNYFMDV
jgi:hypothetical protein